MNRIDELIANPGIYYDPEPVDGWINYCEKRNDTDGGFTLVRHFQTLGRTIVWVVLLCREVYQPDKDGHGKQN